MDLRTFNDSHHRDNQISHDRRTQFMKIGLHDGHTYNIDTNCTKARHVTKTSVSPNIRK